MKTCDHRPKTHFFNGKICPHSMDLKIGSRNLRVLDPQNSTKLIQIDTDFKCKIFIDFCDFSKYLNTTNNNHSSISLSWEFFYPHKEAIQLDPIATK